MMKKKICSILLTVAMVAALSAGCGKSGNDEAKEQMNTNKTESSEQEAVGKNGDRFEEPVTLTYLTWNYADRTPSTDKWIADCEEKFNIVIEMQNVATANYRSTFKAKMSGDDMTDLFMIHDLLPTEKGYLMDNTTVAPEMILDLSDLENVKLYSDETLETTKVDGKLTRVSITMNPMGVLYNRKVFADNNLEIPSNIDEFMNVMDTLKGNGIAPLVGSFADAWSAQIIPYIAIDNWVVRDNPEIGKQLYDKSTNKRTLKWSETGEKMEESLGLVKTWIDDGYFTDDPLGTDANVASQLLANGDAAMFVTGAWQYSVASQACEEGVEIGFFPLPLNEEGEDLYVPGLNKEGNEGMCINAESENVEAAKIAMNYYLSEEIQTLVSEDMGALSTNQNVISDDHFIQDIKKAAEENTAPFYGFWDHRGFGWFSGESGFATPAEMQSLAAGITSPADFCEKLDESMNDIVEK